MNPPTAHTHISRGVKPRGECPACDIYHGLNPSRPPENPQVAHAVRMICRERDRARKYAAQAAAQVQALQVEIALYGPFSPGGREAAILDAHRRLVDLWVTIERHCTDLLKQLDPAEAAR